MNKKFKDTKNMEYKKIYLLSLLNDAKKMALKSKNYEINQLIKKRSNF